MERYVRWNRFWARGSRSELQKMGHSPVQQRPLSMRQEPGPRDERVSFLIYKHMILLKTSVGCSPVAQAVKRKTSLEFSLVLGPLLIAPEAWHRVMITPCECLSE